MSEEQLKAFLEKVQGDTSLQEKLKAAADANAVVAIAKEAGFVFTSEDLSNAEEDKILSNDELELAVGGRGWSRTSTHEFNAAGVCDPTKFKVVNH